MARAHVIAELAGPLLQSMAFKRLSHVTFLGILSPRFRELPGSPHRAPASLKDGTRAHHSVGVAQILLRMAHGLRLSWRTQRYAAAWALTHDIATWPLSHTGDAGFEGVTNTAGRNLRRMMIEGDQRLSSHLSVRRELREMRVDPGILLALYSPKPIIVDPELSILWKIIHSPITPDSVEGMARSGYVYDVEVPSPERVVRAVYRDMFSDVIVDSNQSSSVIDFWRAKSRIYDRHINSARSIEFESAWSRAIENIYARARPTLDDTLHLSEDHLVAMVLTRGAPRFDRIKRYKSPLAYLMSAELARKRRISQSIKIDDLGRLLFKAERSLQGGNNAFGKHGEVHTEAGD